MARFLVLGSASPELLKQSAESFAGRIGYMDLAGFVCEEIRASQWEKLWVRGGFPLSFLARSETASLEWRRALVRDFLGELGLKSWLKTSGGKGLHVVVPLAPRDDYDTVKNFSRRVVEHIARVVPSRFVAKSGPSNRVGKIFVDYLRNGYGATTATAWSARARNGLGVSVPVDWSELNSLKGGAQWTIVDAPERFEAGNAAWAGYWKSRQTLVAPIKKLGSGRR